DRRPGHRPSYQRVDSSSRSTPGARVLRERTDPNRVGSDGVAGGGVPSGGGKKVTTVTDAGRSSIRNCDANGAWSASATTTLIGVTWAATTTVRPAWRSSRR